MPTNLWILSKCATFFPMLACVQSIGTSFFYCGQYAFSIDKPNNLGRSKLLGSKFASDAKSSNVPIGYLQQLASFKRGQETVHPGSPRVWGVFCASVNNLNTLSVLISRILDSKPAWLAIIFKYGFSIGEPVLGCVQIAPFRSTFSAAST